MRPFEGAARQFHRAVQGLHAQPLGAELQHHAGGQGSRTPGFPAVGSTVSAAPTQVTITFTEGVEPAFSKLVVQDASGASVNAGPIHRVGTDTYQLAAPLKKVGAGTYKVIWHAVSVDTHKTSGTFTFTVTQ